MAHREAMAGIEVNEALIGCRQPWADLAQAAAEAATGRGGLELWPDGHAAGKRTAILDRLGHCAQLSGDLAEAARAWREVDAAHRDAGDSLSLAGVQRRPVGVYEVQGAWERALAARDAAAAAARRWRRRRCATWATPT